MGQSKLVLPADPDGISAVLDKVLSEAALKRVPKHPDQRDVVLALLARGLDRRYPYTEPELRERLEEALAEMSAEVDHVTCRRYMVDLGFLKRDRAGTRYFLNTARLAESVTDQALAEADQLIDEVIAAKRARRKGHALP